MSDDQKPSSAPASTRPDVEVVFKEVMATEHGKPKSQP
ncbi:hypothetical protein JOE67_000596 [Microbacterium esteraromaticum]|nr:hypothetical protein [Microbacterium esteraromaticum]